MKHDGDRRATFAERDGASLFKTVMALG